ncbi:MAG: complex I NDUFA9 subunit family protein [Usitatibacter sp.]
MDIESICLIGGTGFVGRSIAEHACGELLRVRVVTRSEARARELLVLPTLETMVADPNDEKSLARAFENMDAVVNLAGILHPGGGATFESVHVGLPRKIARAARAAGVRRLLHMSALGASAGAPSEYLRTKARGEAAVLESAKELAVTIFRPSVIFGEHDRFLNLFATLVRLFPVIPLGSADARFQPVWVEDVARCFMESLGDSRTFGQAYDLCGKDVYTLEEMVRFVAAVLKRKPRIVALPPSLAALQAAVFEHLPGKLLTRDNLRSMSVANVCSADFPAVFCFEPASLETVAAEYLVGTGARSRYQGFRNHAGRETWPAARS